MREWALDRWSENTQVDLSKELLRIKAEIKIEREVEEQAQQERFQKEFIEDCTSLADLQVR
jgi:G2/mitotic-specific cyclin 2